MSAARRPRGFASALAALAAMGAAAAGCGSPAGGTAGGGRADPARPAGEVAAPAPAVLDRADLPGYKSSAPGPGIWSSVEAGGAAGCLGLARAEPVSEVPSPVFSPVSDLLGRQVASDLVVFATASQAALVEHALAGSAGPQCLQSPLRHAFEPDAASAGLRLEGPVETTPLAVAPSGGADWFAYRVAMTAAPAGGHPFPVYDDLMGFRVGRDLVQLETYSSRQLFPGSEERRLLDLLHRLANRSQPGPA